MHWNYRIMERIDGKGTPWEETNLYVVECYYNADDSVLGWTEKDAVYGESLDDLRQILNWMLESLDKPILNEVELLALTKKISEEKKEERLTMDELLDSLGLEREDVESWEGEGGAYRRENKGCPPPPKDDLPTWNGPDSP